MTAQLNMIRGRSNIVTLTNNSGGALIAGDVVIQDTSGDEYVTTTTSAASTSKVLIAAESIASSAAGKFYESGYCPFINVSASVTRGRFLFTHTVAKQAAENATYGTGAFGRILKSGTSPTAIIYSATAQVGSSGVARSGATTDGHLAVWNGSSADSIKDGGAVAGVVGWAPFVAHYAYNHSATVNTNITTLAAVSGGAGGAIASPIWVPTYAKLDTLTIRNNDSSATREAEFRLYLDSGNDNNTLSEVPNSNGTFSFTGTGSANKSAAFASAPVTVGPGLYWLVIRNTSATQTFLLQAQSTGTMIVDGYQLKSIPALGATLDFVAATWTKSNNILAAVISCRVFGQTTAY